MIFELSTLTAFPEAYALPVVTVTVPSVDEATLPAEVRATHRSLFDGSLQGLEFKERPAFGFQGHPEASPGPHDLRGLFDHFNQLMLRRLQRLLAADA